MTNSNSKITPQTSEKAIDTVNRACQHFRPVLQSIRNKLGAEWAQYEECILEILRGISREEDVSAWVLELLLLVDSHPEILDDHWGVVFLFGDMGIDICPPLE